MNITVPRCVHLADAELKSVRGSRAVLPLASTSACPKVSGMIYRCLVALLCLLSTGNILAQLRVELEFEQETYLPREPLFAVVRISNSSGQTLVLGTNNQWLSFTVESVDGSIVKQRKAADVEGEFNLPSSSRAKKMVNLAEAYDLMKFGRYVVTATLKIPEWNETVTSRPAVFGIATGVKLWESAFGIPGETSQGRPEIRKFQLLSANHMKALSLYVRIANESEEDTYSLFPLGPLHGFSKPEPQVDRWSNLHVLYQDGARSFRYNVINPDGMLLTRQTWDIANGSRPGMRLSADGRIAVSGGIHRPTSSDLPPPELLTEKTQSNSTALDKPIDADKVAK
ncbi:MAG TPA: hypothetical protein VK633_06780 [Verrucomicrobiae bacterium]|nr:hypothetical protein [Verrucomicrobiae bacterium]